MYDQFSQAARKAFQIANQEAIRSRHEYIGCEHILLGILAQGDSVVEACESLGVPAHRIRWEIESLLAESTSRPEAPPAKKVVEFAIEESRNLNHQEIDTHHILLGLLRSPDNQVVVALKRVGLAADLLRQELLRRFPPGDAPAEPPLNVVAKRFENRPEVKSLLRMLDEIQRKLEESVSAHKFEAAAHYRDQKIAIRSQLRALLARLDGM